jgi:hypothetical protein
MVLLNIPPYLVVDAFGLPGDAPSDMPLVLSTISCIMEKTGVRWCLVGDILLIYYNVPRYVPTLMYPEDHFDIRRQDIEICVPFEDFYKVREVFNAGSNFCSPFQPGRSSYNQHLAQYPRLKVNGMHQCFLPCSRL